MIGTFKLCVYTDLAHTGDKKKKKKKHLWQKAPDLAVDLITVQLLNCVLPRQDFLDSSILTIGWWKKKSLFKKDETSIWFT